MGLITWLFEKKTTEVVEEVAEETCCEDPHIVDAIHTNRMKLVSASFKEKGYDCVIQHLEESNISCGFISMNLWRMDVKINGKRHIFTVRGDDYKKSACINCKTCLGWFVNDVSVDYDPTEEVGEWVDEYIKYIIQSDQEAEVKKLQKDVNIQLAKDICNV